MGDGNCCGGGGVSGVVVLEGARRGDVALRPGGVLEVLELALRRRVEVPLRRVEIVLRSGGVEAEEEVVGGRRRVVFSSVQPQPGQIRLVRRAFASSLHCR